METHVNGSMSKDLKLREIISVSYILINVNDILHATSTVENKKADS